MEKGLPKGFRPDKIKMKFLSERSIERSVALVNSVSQLCMFNDNKELIIYYLLPESRHFAPHEILMRQVGKYSDKDILYLAQISLLEENFPNFQKCQKLLDRNKKGN